jgi:hypothetical protein
MGVWADLTEEAATVGTAAGVSIFLLPGMGMSGKFMLGYGVGMLSDVFLRSSMGGLSSSSIYRSGFAAGAGAAAPSLFGL